MKKLLLILFLVAATISAEDLSKDDTNKSTTETQTTKITLNDQTLDKKEKSDDNDNRAVQNIADDTDAEKEEGNERIQKIMSPYEYVTRLDEAGNENDNIPSKNENKEESLHVIFEELRQELFNVVAEMLNVIEELFPHHI